MNRTTRRATVRRFCLLSVVALAGAAGCAPDQRTYSRDSQAATEAFDQGADRSPSVGTLMTMAGLLAQRGKESECRYVLQRVIRENPGYAPAYNALAEHHMREGRLDEAIRTLDIGTARVPGDAVLHNNLGLCRLMKGDCDAALDSFTAAAAASPSDSRYRANMAVALAMAGRAEEARALYCQILPPDEADRNIALLAGARRITSDHETARATPEPRPAPAEPRSVVPAP